MGALGKFSPPDLIIIDEVGSVPAEVFEQLISAPPVPRTTDLNIKRDTHGFIKSAVGYNAAGEKVTFEFNRDGKKFLKGIKVTQ